MCGLEPLAFSPVKIPTLVNANLISRVSGTEDGTLRSKQCVKTMSASHVVENGLKHDHLGAEGMGMAQMTFRFFTALLHKGNLIPLMCHDRKKRREVNRMKMQLCCANTVDTGHYFNSNK